MLLFFIVASSAISPNHQQRNEELFLQTRKTFSPNGYWWMDCCQVFIGKLVTCLHISSSVGWRRKESPDERDASGEKVGLETACGSHDPLWVSII